MLVKGSNVDKAKEMGYYLYPIDWITLKQAVESGGVHINSKISVEGKSLPLQSEYEIFGSVFWVDGGRTFVFKMGDALMIDYLLQLFLGPCCNRSKMGKLMLSFVDGSIRKTIFLPLFVEKAALLISFTSDSSKFKNVTEIALPQLQAFTRDPDEAIFDEDMELNVLKRSSRIAFAATEDSVSKSLKEEKDGSNVADLFIPKCLA